MSHALKSIHSDLAKDCVERFLLLPIAWWLHFPLFDCLVITNLTKGNAGNMSMHYVYYNVTISILMGKEWGDVDVVLFRWLNRCMSLPWRRMYHKNEILFLWRSLHELGQCVCTHVWVDSTVSPSKDNRRYISSSNPKNVTLRTLDVLYMNLTQGIFNPTSPSQAPDSKMDRLLECLAMQLMPSRCPSKDPTKGLANTRSSLVALRARVYSLGTSKGWRVGS